MHVFIGGAHSGKTAYAQKVVEGQDAVWLEAVPLIVQQAPVVVIDRLEDWLVTQDLSDEDAVVAQLMTQVRALNEASTVYLVVADVGRGIVPMDKKLRQLRDVCGRFYQQLFAEADSVTRIWYGLAEVLK
ncbi:bifunctional adenosylcobinamide kinase/adenosylcobinamide-phosphate guanylyltransferase [Metalysinibacillus jejuensis]|uniref:bifunctional adenosylcobinamide kinase/adenosylcobinamide-phosphate guanylyltransferase n=1 Tax=Metalysinibacillus jejuensis TaxID=914327 RepID=UPI000D3698C5|nr:bifunctional adenosylcobinamide kinase/adenosylcobinamide-phosphate guanylyltransferase [Metalysinibacillus jejuensis]